MSRQKSKDTGSTINTGNDREGRHQTHAISVRNITRKVTNKKSLSKCERCNGAKCCRYVTQPIKTPRSIKDFDTLLWQVAHHNTHVFKDDDGWFLMFDASCQFVTDNGRCGIYHNRPQICRDHSSENCEMNYQLKDCCDLLFSDYDSLDHYCRQRFKNWDKRFR